MKEVQRVVEMVFEKETKGAVRYAEVESSWEKMLVTLYVRKSAIEGGKPPERIKVTVDW